MLNCIQTLKVHCRLAVKQTLSIVLIWLNVRMKRKKYGSLAVVKLKTDTVIKAHVTVFGRHQ